MEVEALTARLRKFVPPPLRGALKGVRSMARGVHRRFAAPIDAERLAGDLRRAGIREGDTLFVHSSLSSIGNAEGGAETIVASLLEAVGESGTIAMPTYGTAEGAIEASRAGRPVDLRTEPSQTGKVTECFRNRPGVFRSSHPFASVCAAGAQAAYLTCDHHRDRRICHADSPLARLLSLDAKIVGLGVSLGPVSFYHVIEDTWEGFPFQTYAEPVRISYVDATGSDVSRDIAHYDRKITPRRIDADGGLAVRQFMTEHLGRKGILHGFRYGQSSSWWMPARDLYDELKRLAGDGRTIYASEGPDAQTTSRTIV